LENHNNAFISNIIMDSIRILILISKFEIKKSFKLNIEKIMLYDYYMKFPNTMIETNSLNIDIKYNFYEYYSFYHWKPVISDYMRILKYLLSKDLIKRNLDKDKKEYYYEITDKGQNFIDQLSSNYKKVLDKISEFVKNNISIKKDSEVEQEILYKTNVINRFKGEENGEKI